MDLVKIFIFISLFIIIIIIHFGWRIVILVRNWLLGQLLREGIKTVIQIIIIRTGNDVSDRMILVNKVAEYVSESCPKWMECQLQRNGIEDERRMRRHLELEDVGRCEIGKGEYLIKVKMIQFIRKDIYLYSHQHYWYKKCFSALLHLFSHFKLTRHERTSNLGANADAENRKKRIDMKPILS